MKLPELFSHGYSKGGLRIDYLRKPDDADTTRMNITDDDGHEHSSADGRFVSKGGGGSAEKPFTIAGMTLEQATKLAEKHGHKDVADKIRKHPSGWVQELTRLKDGDKAEASQKRKDTRAANWKPSEDHQAVLDRIGEHGKTFIKSQDMLMYAQHKKATEDLIKRGIIDRTDSGREVSYRLLDSGKPASEPKPHVTKTPAFKKWFGESKVVDDAGEPLRVFHGTASNFDEFKTSGDGGIYFGSSPDLANEYAEIHGRWKGGTVSIKPVYLRIENDGWDRMSSKEYQGLSPKESHKRLISEGYDGYSIDGMHVVFSPNQIKSATGNRGTFDDSPDIRMNVTDREGHDHGNDGKFVTKGGSSGTDRAAKIERVKAIKAEIAPLMARTGGYLSEAEGKQHKALMKELSDLHYDVGKPLTLERIKSPAERQSTLPAEIVMTAYHDLMANRPAYTAIMDAAAGTWHNADTPVDDIMDGKHPDLTPEAFYGLFDATREAMRAHYGKKVPLFRAVGYQKDKATTNWATTREYAEQFGEDVIHKRVPIEDVIAVNVSNNGAYHEIIVGRKPGSANRPYFKVTDDMRAKLERGEAVALGRNKYSAKKDDEWGGVDLFRDGEHITGYESLESLLKAFENND